MNLRGSAPGYLNTPDDAYLLPNGLVTVADAYNCRVLFISRSHRIVRQYGTTGVCRHDPPRELGAVNGATPLPDGGTLVSEITGSWIDDIGPGREAPLGGAGAGLVSVRPAARSGPVGSCSPTTRTRDTP